MKSSDWRKGNKEKDKIWGKRSWDERIAQHFKAHALPKVAKEVIMGRDVYVGVSDEKHHDAPDDYPSGYYRTGFAVAKPRPDGKRDFFVQILEFDGQHDPEYTDYDKLRGRLNTTVRTAREHIEIGIQGGQYEK